MKFQRITYAWQPLPKSALAALEELVCDMERCAGNAIALDAGQPALGNVTQLSSNS